MLAKRVGTIGHGRIHLAALLHFIRVAVVVNRQRMHFMLLGQGWNQMLGYAPEARLYTHVAAIKNLGHKKIKAGLILGRLLDYGKARRA